MPETDPPAPFIEAPQAEGASRRISAVWLVPLLALVLALGVAWHTYSQRGPTIEIVFDNAAGVVAGQTTIRFRDVVVGVVERLALSPDLTQVIATARIDKDAARYVDADAQFWIVRPSVNAQGISGIETVLSGVYIAAYWDNQIAARETHFVGLAREPQTRADQPGMRVQLRAPSGGSLGIGAPVLFKSIQVGRIENVELTDAGDVAIDAFIGAPYHLRLTEGTRFWNASGFSIEIGGGGASLNVDSLVSLLQGGVSFDTVGSNTAPVTSGHVYDLYPTESAARQNYFDDELGERLLVDANFDGSVAGLQPGAAVRFRGLQVGEVEAIQAAVVEDGQPRVTLRATLAIAPARIGVPDDSADPSMAALAQLETQVAGGLRARLGTTGLLAQSLYVELAEIPDATPATLDRDARPNPLMPSVPADVSGIATSAEGVLRRISSLPLEQVVQNAATLLGNLNALVTDERVRSAPENLGALLADLRTMLDSSGIKQAPAELSALLASARGMIDEAMQAKVVAEVAAVLETAKAAVASVDSAAKEVPELVEEIEGVAREIRTLPLAQLVSVGTRLVGDMDTFVNSQEVASVPASVNASLAELRTLMEALRTGGAIDNLNATLASARQVTDELVAADLAASLQSVIAEARTASVNVSIATGKAPALMDSLTALSEKVDAMPLEELVASATGVVRTADTLLASEGVAEVPPRLAAALDQLRGLLADLREGGAIDNLNATLASARQVTDELVAADLAASLQGVIAEARTASANVSTATGKAPALMDSLTALSEKVDAMPLEELVASATGVVRTADTLLASEGVAEVPPRLAAALDQLRGLLAELREGGAVNNLNSTLASADRAADAITAAADDLPALVANLNRVAAQAEVALASVSPGSDVNRDTLLLLQEVRDAARSVNSLVLALERRPNSVLFGR